MNKLLPGTLTSIDRNIGYYIVEQKITRERMAELLGMNANTLRWKREGKSPWKWDEILQLSEITGKSPDELAGINQVVTA